MLFLSISQMKKLKDYIPRSQHCERKTQWFHPRNTVTNQCINCMAWCFVYSYDPWHAAVLNKYQLNTVEKVSTKYISKQNYLCMMNYGNVFNKKRFRIGQILSPCVLNLDQLLLFLEIYSTSYQFHSYHL